MSIGRCLKTIHACRLIERMKHNYFEYLSGLKKNEIEASLSGTSEFLFCSLIEPL